MRRMQMSTAACTASSERTAPARPAARVPYRLPWLGHGPEFGRDPDGFLARCKERHGPVFELLVLGTRRTILLDPLDFPAFFQNRDLVFRAAADVIGERVFGYTTAAQSPDLTEELVHAIQVHLKNDALIPVTERMNRIFLDRVFSAVGTEWTHDHLFRFLDDHVLVAGLEALFGDGFYTPELRSAYKLIDRMFPLLAVGVPGRAIPGVRAAQNYLGDALISSRANRSEVLNVRVEIAKKLGLGPRETGMVNSPIIWASQANTIATAFWTVLLVLRDPHARAQIAQELAEVGGGGGVLSYEMLRKMVKLDSAINEATRLMSLPLSIREATKDMELPLASGGRLLIRKGEQLSPYPRMTHMDPDIYEDPHVFKFDRYLATKGPKHFYKNGQRVSFALLPFGAGESMCPGRFFARNEFKIVVATLLSAFDVELQSAVVPELMVSRVGLGVPPPVKDVPFRIRKKRG